MDSPEFYSISSHPSMMSTNSAESSPNFSSTSPPSTFRISEGEHRSTSPISSYQSPPDPLVMQPCLNIDPLGLSTRSVSTPIVKVKGRRRPKKATADSCIRRLCASHQTDIGLLCDLWSSPASVISSGSLPLSYASPSSGFDKNHKSTPISHCTSSFSSPTVTESAVFHIPPSSESERQRLLQLEMQLMRMQLQQAELLLPPSRGSSPLVGLTRSASVPLPFDDSSSDGDEGVRKPQLRLPLDEDPTPSLHIAQEVHQNLVWAEADYRAKKRGSKPNTPTCDSPLDFSDCSGGPSMVASDFVNVALCQGYLKLPRGNFCKFWCAKKRFCMLDSARCFFYWKSQEQRDSGRAKCFSGVVGGALVPGDDKALELTYAGGTCVVVLRCDTAAEANRWLMALGSLDVDSSNERRMTENEIIDPIGISLSHQGSVVSSGKSSPNPDLLRRTLAQAADSNTRREVIQNAFLDEFRKEQQFEQLLRASKSSVTSSCAREGSVSPLAFQDRRVH